MVGSHTAWAEGPVRRVAAGCVTCGAAPAGSPPRPPVPPHHDQPEVSAHLLSVRLSHGWVRVSIEPGGLRATAPGTSRSRNPIREYVEPGVSGLCVLVALSSWFGSTEDVRNSAQRDPRNLCPLLRMISLRRQGPGERMDLRPRWMPTIGHERLSSGTENPIGRNRVLGASHSVPITPCTLYAHPFRAPLAHTPKPKQSPSVNAPEQLIRLGWETFLTTIISKYE